MCGISGVYGKEAPLKALYITLCQLDRGVEGTGVAWIKKGEIKVKKEEIHPIQFLQKYIFQLPRRVRVAIGHNRLPSVGTVRYENTHPFVSCDGEFALVHNGSAMAHKLRRELEERGHKIYGETDSELLCHRLEEYYYQTKDMKKALMRLYKNELSGAILVLTRDGEIWGIRTGFWTPLIVGETEEGIYVASEEKAIKTITHGRAKITPIKVKQILHIADGNVEIIGKGITEVSITTYRYDYWRSYSPRRTAYIIKCKSKKEKKKAVEKEETEETLEDIELNWRGKPKRWWW